jgi:hypothetical protein
MSQHVVEYTLLEATDMFNEVIDATLTNLNKGIKESITYSLVGDPGLGKTDLPKQLAAERGFHFEQVDLAQYDDLVALMGYPTKYLYMQKPMRNELGDIFAYENKPVKIDQSLVNYYLTVEGYKPTGEEPVLGYAKPEWVTNLEKSPQGSILVFNDYSRCVKFVYQAVMELLQNREYNNWRLPDNCIIFCSENPDNGSHHVHVQDDAQADRIVKIHVKYDEKAWAAWAEKAGIRDECINFMLSDSMHVVGDPEGTIKGISPRRWTKLFRMIQNLPDFSSQESLQYIMKHGSQIVQKSISNFTTFLANGMYQIIKPSEMLNFNIKTEDIERKIAENTHHGGGYFRADISAMIAIRFKNYLGIWVKDNPVDEQLLNRLEAILTNKRCFQTDSVLNILEVIQNDKRFTKLLRREKIFKLFKPV